MKKFVLIISTVFSFLPAFSRHITGGEVIYDYKGLGAGNAKRYTITLRLFRDENCINCAALPSNVVMGVYNNDNNQLINGYTNVPLSSEESPLSIVSAPPCLSNTPALIYKAGYYSFDIELPANGNGYTVSYQTCCRVDGIANASNDQGSTYSGEIPGDNALNGGTDNSARFVTGLSIVCANKPFKLNFSATDPDADNLVYDFYNAYNGGGAIVSYQPSPANYPTPAGPPYSSINYVPGFSGFNPFGINATINPATGIISGIAPASGKYIVAVVVKSYRAGNLIATHRKDFIVTVAPCDFASSELNLTYVNCDNRVFNFKNENSSLLNLTFDWDFGDPASGIENTSTQEFPQHTYSADGTYTLRLIVNNNTPCSDTAYAIVKVYPGFFPKIKPILPQCKNTPIQFIDQTTTSYPPLVYWKWDFGVTTITSDTSRLQNPTYTYTTAGAYTATLIVESTKGCRDTVTQDVTITDRANFVIPKDTLICAIDTIQIPSNVNTGVIVWTPNTAINNVNSYSPLVSPDITQIYTADYTDPFGCKATESIKVNVVNEVTLLALSDTTICRTDTAKLNLNTDALYFIWTAVPASTITTPTIRNPIIQPTAPITTYHVKASISNKCFKEKDIVVNTVPYPSVTVSTSAPICLGKDAQLNATGGSSYVWSPVTYLSNANIPNPQVLKPLKTITYTVTVKDTFGCPKPVIKPITVDVIKIIADAGPSDTSIVLDQPLQLNATGSINYFWTTPNTWLTKIDIPNPIANPLNNITYKVLVSDNNGCEASDTINVKVFFLPPDIYVPSAFTPSADGKNDLFRPIPLGIKSLELFSVYDRWGNVLFTTSKIGAGWDGKYKGIIQNPGTYVWQANATDYKNKKVARKGTVILIR